MGSKLRAGAACALLLLLASVAVASAGSPTGNRSSGSDDRKSVFRLIGRDVASAWLDLGDPGNSLGDQFHFTSDLIRADETKVGEDGGSCSITRIAPDGATTYHCAGTNSLPDGQITAQGLVTYGPGEEEFRQKPYFFAITGGTGKYRAARGEIKIQELSAEEVRLTLRVIL